MDQSQMAESFPKDFKVVVLQNKNHSQDDLKEPIIQCSNIPELETVLKKNQLSSVKLACEENQWIDVIPLLKDNPNIDTVYILTNLMDILWPTELDDRNLQCIEITDPIELIRQLYLQVMMCYFQQGEHYKKNGNSGLANQCFLDAEKAINQVDLLLLS